jgi:regulator of protease activity HflC (stomatin/prohibitin superfamily)
MLTALYVLGVLVAIAMGITIICFPFIARALAAQNRFFTFPQSNAIKAVDIGKRFSGKWILGDLDRDMDNDGKIIRANRDPSFLEKRVGPVWIGVFGSVHTITIVKEYENLSGKGPGNWITHGETKDMDFLKLEFPRPFVFTDIELKDRLTVSVKVVGKFEVVDPKPAMYQFNGGTLFTQIGSLLQGEVNDILKGFDIDEFVQQPKGETNGLLSQMKEPYSPFNQELIRQTGVRATGLCLNDYEPGDAEVLEAIRQQALAQKQGDAAVLAATKAQEKQVIDSEKEYNAKVRQAEQEARTLEIQTQAQMASQNLLTEARATRVRETIRAFTVQGADPNTIAAAAAQVLTMEAATGPQSKLNVLVEGGGLPTSVPLPLPPIPTSSTQTP